MRKLWPLYGCPRDLISSHLAMVSKQLSDMEEIYSFKPISALRNTKKQHWMLKEFSNNAISALTQESVISFLASELASIG